jgi:hypothetical protein
MPPPAPSPEPAAPNQSGPWLKVTITQDPVRLEPKLAISATQDQDALHFTLTCNYVLFLARGELRLYDAHARRLKTMPLPATYMLKRSDLPSHRPVASYQLAVFDAQGHEDRTAVGRLVNP